MSHFDNRFPSWGETGESPIDGFSYNGGDLVNEKHLDYLWDSLRKQTNDIQETFDDIDSNSDGIVDAADTANRYKGSDIDSDGDGVVNKADDVVRRYRETNIPHTEMADGDEAVGLRRRIPDGKTMNIWEVGVVNDTNGAPNGLDITVQNHDELTAVTRLNTVYYADDPINSVDGPVTVVIKVDNETGGPQNASGFVLYSVD